jgi:5'-nucleotidase
MGVERWWWGFVALACGSPPPAERFQLSELTLLHTSDVHSHLWPFRDRISSVDASLGLGDEGQLAEVGGAARLATLLAEERRGGDSLWLDSGDLLEGTPVFGRFGGTVEVEAWEALGVAAMALGNHELSLSEPELERLFGAASFPILAANLRANSGRAWLTPSATLFAGRVALGVIGCANTGSPPSLSSETNPWQLSAADAAASVQANVDALAPHVDLTVVLSHLGLEGGRELVRGTTGIDLVLGGHQHTLTLSPQWEEDCATRDLRHRRGCTSRRVPIVHSGAYGRYLSRLELELRASTAGGIEVNGVTLAHLPVSENVAEEASTVTRLRDYLPESTPPLGYVPERLARSSAVGGDSPLGNLVTGAVQAETGADVVLLNNSALRDELEAGILLKGDLERAFPFDEPWRLAWLSGRELRAGLDRAARKSAGRGCTATLEVSGLWLRIHCAACGDELTECWHAGRGEKELRDDERLLVALPRYLTTPGADFESLGRTGAELSLSVSEAIQRFTSRAELVQDSRACQRDLERLSARRCAEAFGVWCPVVGQRAQRICSGLPLVEGARDGRVEMRP